MRSMKRWAAGSAIWIVLALGILSVWAAARWWPRPAPRMDAASPARNYPPELLGPSAREVVEGMGRRGYPSPSDVVE